MKKSFLYIIGIAFALFASCENIAEEERLIEMEGVTAQRVVLLEEYTGQRCKNCPEAHEEAAELHEQYKENLIVVSMHAGDFGISTDRDGLMQPEGDDYAKNASVKDYPSGVINRRGEALQPEFWGATLREEIQKPSVVQLELYAALSEDTIKVSASTIALDSIDNAKLQLWILEDSIVKLQLMPDGKRNYDYVHNHVYRHSVNGVGGESVELPFGEPVVVLRSCPKAEDWVAENLSVVAFVYNKSGVLQAAQCKLSLE